MLNDYEGFKFFLMDFLKMLEELSHSENFRNKNDKFLAQLRTAERTFNFLMDQFPHSKVQEVFGLETWNSMKMRRDQIARIVADAIESEPDVKNRYNAYCEFLKDTRRISSLL